MALKVNMEQAYDCMVWETLQKVMTLMGFKDRFIMWVMQCITRPKFTLLIDGNRTQWIDAKSGLRQGCPLSPYLFILCSELLTKAFKQRGGYLGIQAAMNIRPADEMQDRSWSCWTSIVAGRAKRSIIVHEKVNLWGKKFLSLAGRALLINTSMLYVPMYVMTHTSIPNGVLNATEWLGRRFFWQTMLTVVTALCWVEGPVPTDELGSVDGEVWNEFVEMQGKSVSITRKVIQDGAKVLRPILRWNIGNGNQIDVLHDGNQILDRNIAKWPTFVDIGKVESMKIGNLLNNSLWWDEAKVEHCFGKIKAERITTIHLLSGSGEDMNSLGELTVELLKYADKNPSMGRIYCYTVYQVWRARNDMKHHQMCRSPSVIAAAVLSLLPKPFKWPILEQWSTNQPIRMPLKLWCPHPPGWLKYNFDATLMPSNQAGLGMIVRDHFGKLVFSAGRCT
ncbi:uncharacterized protein LOC110101895 [Dendrobium catenatum]|uniref:uncharacterized protein LOC110101895 n=1 Tax=Dendrobium catenatum TaxID=906689 RepID=UPI0009F23672|nr:uncharacterized protein LOC110101895 [Dendrobium catenatum]